MGLGALLPSLFGAAAAPAVTGGVLTAGGAAAGATIGAGTLGALAGPAGIISAATPGIALGGLAAPVAGGFGVLSALQTGLGLLSGVSSIAGGLQAQEAAGAQAEQARILAATRAAEQTRLALRGARVEAEEAGRLARRQKLAFLASGVTLSGSPLLVLEETRRKGLENIEEILKAGGAASEAITAEGRLQAGQLERGGRQEFISGLTTGITTIGGALV